VGARLLAKAVCHPVMCWLTECIREQARSHRELREAQNAGTKKPDSMVGLFLSAKTDAYLARPL
jgi:hypothetical protein